jgi:hypothetical protein
MQDTPLGTLLLLAVFILLPLINWLLQRIGRRYDRQLPQEPPRQPAPRTYAKLPSFESTPSIIQEAPVIEVVESSLRPRRRRRNKIFTSRGDLRRAILMMTVLGPCRAVTAADAERQQFPG